MHNFTKCFALITLVVLAIVNAGCGGAGNTAQNPLENVAQGNESILTSIKTTVPAGTCPNGGVTVDSGFDMNGNGILDPSEVTNQQYVCNGSDGAVALVSVTAEPDGMNCTDGGKKIDVGIDTNESGILDSSEVTSSGFVCNGKSGSNGMSGFNSLLSIVPESSGTHCANGGVKVSSGLDINGSGLLDPSEVTSTNYVCNGSLGSYVYLTSIAVSPTTPTLAKGLTQQFAAIGTYSDGTTFDLTKSVTWSSSKAAVATIDNTTDSNGLANAVAIGTTTITATLASNILVSGSTTLTVTPATLANITVTPTSQTIVPGTTLQFTATGKYTDNSTQDLTTTVTWNSSINTVATISNEPGSNGEVTSVDTGTTTITATAGSISGFTTLSVSMTPPTNVKATTGDEENTVTWNSSPGAASYNLYWSTTSPVTKSSGTKISDISSPYTHTELSNGTKYYYIVTSVYSNGEESSESLETSAIPLAIPAVLASGLINPDGIAVDATSVYTIEEQGGSFTIIKINIANGNITTIASGLNQLLNIILVDTTNMYFFDSSGNVHRGSTNGGPLNIVGQFNVNITALAVDAIYVYCTDVQGDVVKMNLTTGVVTKILTKAFLYPTAVAVDATSLYVIDQGDNSGKNGSINKINLSNNSITTLATGIINVASAITIDSSYVYFVSPTNNFGIALQKISKNGGSITTIGTEIYWDTQMAADVNNIYYTNGANTVFKMSK